MGFQSRILFSMLLVILVSMAGTMFVAWQFANEQEEAYNVQRLERKEASVQRSLEYTLDRLPHTLETRDIPEAFSDRICELADIHGMDIALYHPEGRLLTQSTIHDDESADIVLSEILLGALENSDERIQGLDEGPSVKVYWNVRDQKNRILGIVGVRYQKRALESGDFRAFWSQLAPLYVVLFLVGAMLAAVLSNGLVQNLRLIRDRMRTLEPGVKQTPIAYKRHDAIGELVAEYNALLEQLNSTVNELAKREREGAWRMMAMQVAHEIKNPLTPIKLGAQNLERAWADQRPDFEERLQRYCHVVGEQINVLSQIAQDFSVLAASGLRDLERVDVGAILKEVADLHRASQLDIDWSVEIPEEGPWMMGSKPHLISVFNNLITNAVDAVSSAQNPAIQMSIEATESTLTVSIKDNGVGISADQLDEIFQPRFTSKKHGTGLGLAITQTIVNQLNGTIKVYSKHGESTAFIVSLPVSCATFEPRIGENERE